MTWLVTTLVARGISERLARALAYAAAALLAIAIAIGIAAALAHWIHGREDTAVQLDRKDMTIEAANRVIAADREATANQTARDDAFANAQQELRDEVRDNGSAAPVGGAVSGVLDRMREQQAAHRR